mgnify:FL=1
MLSNTEYPYYYKQFRDAVINGEIPVNEMIEMQMNRIDAKIADPNIYYDKSAVDGYIRFVENELVLTDGGKINVLPSFKLWAEDLYGWYYFIERSVPVPNEDGRGTHYETKRIKKRLTHMQYIIVSRGASKSVYAGTIQAYELICDPVSIGQICVAPTLRQADEVMATLTLSMIKKPGPVLKFLTNGSVNNTTGNKENQPKLVKVKDGIENRLTGGKIEIRPMRIDKLQGLRLKSATVDEWLSGDIRENPIEAIEQGGSKYDDYIVVCISSEGTVRNGPGDSIKMELLKILRGEVYDPFTSIFWYKLDDIKEVGDPSMWLKCNPNLGITVPYEVYQQAVEKAEHNPALRNDILAKRFGLPMEGFTYFFTYEETKPHRHKEFWQMPCTMGADLSQGDDFCAFTFLFPLRQEEFGIKCRSYITEYTLSKLPGASRVKYEEFINEGTLIVLPGSILDLNRVYDDLIQYIASSEYDVRAFGYDPYNAKEFVEKWAIDVSPYGVVKVPQGAKTESVPLGELKTLAERRSLLFDQSIMQFTMGNCITFEDSNGNRKLSKKRREDKIDNVAALLDAYVAFKQNRDLFE